jgi:hypothetical protein
VPIQGLRRFLPVLERDLRESACPVATFLPPFLSSEMGDLSEWISTSGTKQSLQGPNIESGAVGERQSSRASAKLHGGGATCEQVSCHDAASRSCFSTPQDPVPDPLLLRKFVSVGNRTWDLWVSSQEL